jgi:hypothetical protein
VGEGVKFCPLIAESELDPSRDEDRQLLTLLAEEVAKDKKPRSKFACLRMDRPL